MLATRLEEDIILYLENLDTKPIDNLNIRAYYTSLPIVLPLVAISVSDINDNIVIGDKVYYSDTQISIEIYVTDMVINNVPARAIDVSSVIINWVDENIRKQFGVRLEFLKPLGYYGKDKNVLRVIARYKGLLSNEGYIYK